MSTESTLCFTINRLLSSSLLSKNLKIKIYRTIILPVVLYGCETWSLTKREGRRLREFQSRVLVRIFGPKRDEVTRECRKLHFEKLNLLTLQLFFLILAHPVYKMLIIQEPNTLEL